MIEMRWYQDVPNASLYTKAPRLQFRYRINLSDDTVWSDWKEVPFVSDSNRYEDLP